MLLLKLFAPRVFEAPTLCQLRILHLRHIFKNQAKRSTVAHNKVSFFGFSNLSGLLRLKFALNICLQSVLPRNQKDRISLKVKRKKTFNIFIAICAD